MYNSNYIFFSLKISKSNTKPSLDAITKTINPVGWGFLGIYIFRSVLPKKGIIISSTETVGGLSNSKHIAHTELNKGRTFHTLSCFFWATDTPKSSASLRLLLSISNLYLGIWSAINLILVLSCQYMFCVGNCRTLIMKLIPTDVFISVTVKTRFLPVLATYFFCVSRVRASHTSSERYDKKYSTGERTFGCTTAIAPVTENPLLICLFLVNRWGLVVAILLDLLVVAWGDVSEEDGPLSHCLGEEISSWA